MCEKCNWEDLIDKIDHILSDETFDWAANTLEGIRDTVLNMEHATDRQWEAVENIEESANR